MKRICLCVFAAVAVIMIFVLNSSLEIVVEYSADQSGSMQVFYSEDKDTAFTAEKSITKTMPQTDGKISSLAFGVPLECINMLRFDIDGVDKISIYSISIKCGILTEQSFSPSQLNTAFKPGVYAATSLEEGKLVYSANGPDPTAVFSEFSSRDHKRFIIIVPIASGLAAAIICYIILRAMKIQPQLGGSSVPDISRLKPVSFIVVCALVITIPSFSYALPNNNSEFENRALAAKPELSISNLDSYPSEYETYLEDNMPLKPAVVTNYSQFLYKALRSSLVNDVIIGQDDWLFYGVKSYNTDVIGTYLDTFEYEEENFSRYITAMNEYCRDNGIEFYVMLCPNKEEIYNHYLPSYLANIERESPLDRAAEKLKGNGVNVIYPYDELKSRRDEALLYMKQDTHWTDKGAYIAYRQFYQAYFGEQLPDLDEIEFKEVEYYQDLAKMLHLENTGIDYDAVYKPEITYSSVGLYGNGSSLVIHSDSLSEKRLVLFGDSFTKATRDFFSRDFTDARFTWSQVFDTHIIEADKPDVVIVELNERTINALPSKNLRNSALTPYLN